MKSKKGFTLVELMIVVAVIALLMVILFPRFGTLRNKTRETGVKANALMLEGIIQSVIDEYTTDEITELEARIIADIEAATDDQTLRNPITGDVGAVENASISSGGAVVYDVTNDNTFATKSATYDGTSAILAAEGMIAVVVHPNDDDDPTKVLVSIIPYGVDGNVMSKSVKTISQ